MKVAVIGATGSAGSKVVNELHNMGHETIEISRSHGVDITTGEGLEAALAGADVCVDAAFAWPGEDQDIVEFLEQAAQRIVDAADKAGVQHIVYLSITNIEKPDVAKFDYYSAKAAQEKIFKQGPVPVSIVRSAQWMEFATNSVSTEWLDEEVRASDWLIQPVALEDVARLLAEVAVEEPQDRTIAGPEVIRIPELVRMILAARGDHREVIATEPPLAALGDGSLLAPQDAELRGPTPQQWVHDHTN